MKSPSIVIADSGSTKTHWCYVSPGAPTQHWYSSGPNPYFQQSTEIISSWKSDLSSYTITAVDEVHFYGSGVSSQENVEKITKTLAHFWPSAKLAVHHDLLGAARGTAGQQAGLVGILGTGSNLCVYDGNTITHSATSLGYLLGDEGSGAVIGREVLAAYWKRTLPEDLREQFKDVEPNPLSQVLDRLYGQPYPNRYLASFARFAIENQQHPWCEALLTRHFEAYFNVYVGEAPSSIGLPLHLIGSVAYYARPTLEKVASKYERTLGQILESPIEGLITYHQAIQP